MLVLEGELTQPAEQEETQKDKAQKVVMDLSPIRSFKRASLSHGRVYPCPLGSKPQSALLKNRAIQGIPPVCRRSWAGTEEATEDP